MAPLEKESLNNNIPIIDFAIWNPSSTPEQRLEVAKSLADACHNFGFVFIINHGTEEKMLAPHPPCPTIHRGYSWPGLEKMNQMISEDLEVGEQLRAVTDFKESYEVGSVSNEEQPNVWFPEEILPNFRSFMTEFYWTCDSVSKEIMKALGLGMGLDDPDFMLKFHSGHNNQLRLLHCPPIVAAALENESSARMPPHSDWGSITMLFQDDCGGLEVENQRVPGEFVTVTPLKNAIVTNIGDLLM